MKPYLKMILATMIAISFLSCSKDINVPEESAVQTAVSTAAKTAVATYQTQKAVAATVDDNIGGYLESIPVDYTTNTSKKYPLLITIHGQGECGNGTTDISLVKRNAIPRLLDQQKFPSSFTVSGVSYSFIVISPQFKAWPKWYYINDMISYAIKHYRVDSSRIYVTGLSMGGGGAWDFGWHYMSRVAALVPMCGASYGNIQKATPIATAGIPVWAFHNQNDPTVPVDWTNNWVTNINSVTKGVKARKTIFAASGHDCWTKASDPAYTENSMNIYQWMLQYKRK